MEEWKTYKIGNLCSISSSKRIFAKEYQSSGIPFFRGKEIIEKQKGESVSTELYISKSRYDEIKNKLSNFLAISDYEVLKHSGTISNEEAQTKAFCEYEKFKLIQDREYLSDFDKELKRLKDKGLFND